MSSGYREDRYEVAKCRTCRTWGVVRPRCRCGGTFDRNRVYRVISDPPVTSVAVPGDPVAWRMRVGVGMGAQRAVVLAVEKWERGGNPPRDAVHRGRTREMFKGCDARFRVRRSVLLKGRTSLN